MFLDVVSTVLQKILAIESLFTPGGIRVRAVSNFTSNESARVFPQDGHGNNSDMGAGRLQAANKKKIKKTRRFFMTQMYVKSMDFQNIF